MINYDDLQDYRAHVRPVGPDGLPYWLEREFARLGEVIRQQAEALKDLNARLATLETP